MFDKLKKWHYEARVLLARGGGQEEEILLPTGPARVRHGGDGRPFVYLHSTLGESTFWLPFFQTWARDFRVLVPTHPGFNQSPGFEGIHDIEDMAFHYLELFDALGLDQVILGGVSLGGWIAAEFAVRWPERVSRLWIADAPGLWIDDEPLPDLFRLAQDRGVLRRLLFEHPDSAMALTIIPDDATPEQMVNTYQNSTVLARLMWERPYNPKLPGRLHRVACPTLLLWGANDRLVPPVYAEAYRRHIPQAELTLIPECGHLPMFEQEHTFVQAVAEFCRS